MYSRPLRIRLEVRRHFCSHTTPPADAITMMMTMMMQQQTRSQIGKLGPDATRCEDRPLRRKLLSLDKCRRFDSFVDTSWTRNAEPQPGWWRLARSYPVLISQPGKMRACHNTRPTERIKQDRNFCSRRGDRREARGRSGTPQSSVCSAHTNRILTT